MTDKGKNPEHYQLLEGVEVIDIIAATMTVSEFKAHCLGHILRYRLRAGNKDSLEQDIAKAEQYKEIFKSKKHLCKDAVSQGIKNCSFDSVRERVLNAQTVPANEAIKLANQYKE